MKKIRIMLLFLALAPFCIQSMEDDQSQISRRCPTIFRCLESTGEILSRSVLLCFMFLRGYGAPRSLRPSDCDRNCAWNRPKEA